MICETEGAPAVINWKLRKARKVHECCECGHQIQPGATYKYTSGLWEGDWDQFKQCEPCADLFDSMTDSGFCPSFAGLFESFFAYLDWHGKGVVHPRDVVARVFSKHREGVA